MLAGPGWSIRMWAFSISRNNTGDLALWWEVAREWRLGRRHRRSVVAARETHARRGHARFRSGETTSIPGTCVPRTSFEFSGLIRLISGWSLMPLGHSQWRICQHDRRETRPHIGGPDGPGGVASSITHPPLLAKSPRDLDDSRAVCPISRTSVSIIGPQVRRTPIRIACQWGTRRF